MRDRGDPLQGDGLEGAIGKALITMLDGCQHRGPDSTGFALYHETNGARILRLRFFVGEGEEAEEAIARIEERLGEFAAEVIEEERVGTTRRTRFGSQAICSSFSYAMEHVAKVVLDRREPRHHQGRRQRPRRRRRLPGGGVHGHARDRPRPPRDRVGGVARGRAPVLGDRLRRRRDRPQRPDHELLEDAAAPREARHGVQHGQRLRADRRLPRRQAGSRHPARGGARDPRSRTWTGRSRSSSRRRTRSATRRTTSPRSRWSCTRTTNLVAIASEEVSLNRLFPGRSLETTEPPPGTFRTWRRSI